MAVRQLYEEKELFRRIADGDEAAFETFFNLYKSKLYHFMLQVTRSADAAEELVHDIFLKIWTARSLLPEVENPQVYIFVAARNKAMDHLRKVSRERHLLDEIWANLQEGHNFTEEVIAVNENQQLIREAVSRLPPQKQLIFRLSREEGLNHEKIAARLNISRSTVNNHLVQSLRIIRQYLRDRNLYLILLLGVIKFFLVCLVIPGF